MYEWSNRGVRRRSSIAVDADNADEIQPLLQGIDQLGYLMKHASELEQYEQANPARVQTA